MMHKVVKAFAAAPRRACVESRRVGVAVGRSPASAVAPVVAAGDRTRSWFGTAAALTATAAVAGATSVATCHDHEAAHVHPEGEEASSGLHEGGFEGEWFGEREVMWPGQQMRIKVAHVLEDFYSRYQHIQVFDSTDYGRVLALDGVIQLTERDECGYQEMIVHPPLFAHHNPRRVLIIGGGDGGALREVARHASVEEIVMVELDKGVTDVAQKYFSSSTATSFGDKRLTLLHQDGAAFVEAAENRGRFDVIIVDSSDPVGPAEVLFEPRFFRGMHSALAEGGIVATQGECMWLHLDVIGPALAHFRDIFDEAGYYWTTVPTYPSGQIGFLIARKGKVAPGCFNSSLSTPQRDIPEALQKQLRYYSADVHLASFVLPMFAERAIDEAVANHKAVKQAASKKKCDGCEAGCDECSKSCCCE